MQPHRPKGYFKAATWVPRMGQHIYQTIRSLTKSPRKLILFVVYTGGVASIGLAIGAWLQHKEVPRKIVSTFNKYLNSNSSQVQFAPWQDINTHLHVIQI